MNAHQRRVTRRLYGRRFGGERVRAGWTTDDFQREAAWYPWLARLFGECRVGVVDMPARPGYKV